MAAGTDEANRGSRSPESQNKSDDGTSVKIVDVAEDATVDVDIDGRIFHVTKGDRFARNFRLLFTNHKCVSMLFGDDQFSICEGEEALK